MFYPVCTIIDIARLRCHSDATPTHWRRGNYVFFKQPHLHIWYISHSSYALMNILSPPSFVVLSNIVYNTQIVIVGITALYCNVETDLCTPALYSTGLYTATSGRPSLLRFHLSDCSSHTHTLPASRQPDTAPVPLISNSFLVKKYFLAIVIKQTLTTKLCSDDTWVTFKIIISLVSIQRIACLD